MTDVLSNQAALLVGQKRPLQVGPGPTQTVLAQNEVLIQVAAVAINPVDWKTRDYMFLPLSLPHVLGSDVAGTVVATGANISRVRVGDRVIGHCVGLTRGGSRHGGFQHFAIVLETVVAKIPESLTLEQASVLPLGLSTSACALFEILGLSLSSSMGNASQASKAVIVWGGASSMGSVGIQLTLAAGYKVITTASVKNTDFVQSLSIPEDGHGSITVFDAYSANVVADIIEHVRVSGMQLAGVYDSIASSLTITACARIQEQLGGNSKIATTLPLMDVNIELPASVVVEVVSGTNPAIVPDHLGAEIWRTFVSAALVDGRLKALPIAEVVGHGLEQVEKAMEIQKAGVSAKKIVVTI